MNDSGSAANLLDYLRVLRQRRLLILGVTLLFGGAALAYSLHSQPMYQAEAALLFQEPSTAVDALHAGGPSRVTSEERAAIGADSVTRPDITRAVRRRLGRARVAGRRGYAGTHAGSHVGAARS